MYAFGFSCIVFAGTGIVALIVEALLFNDDDPEPLDGTGLPEGR